MRLNLYGSPILTFPCYSGVEDIATGKSIARKMEEVLTAYGFKGVSAPQIGFPVNMATVKLENGQFLTMIEPEITRMYGTEIEYMEDCISLPPRTNKCRVLRTVLVDVVFKEIVSGEMLKRQRTYSGRDASTVNHEVDHLSGSFFVDRAALHVKAQAIEKFEEWKRSKTSKALYGG